MEPLPFLKADSPDRGILLRVLLVSGDTPWSQYLLLLITSLLHTSSGSLMLWYVCTRFPDKYIQNIPKIFLDNLNELLGICPILTSEMIWKTGSNWKRQRPQLALLLSKEKSLNAPQNFDAILHIFRWKESRLFVCGFEICSKRRWFFTFTFWLYSFENREPKICHSLKRATCFSFAKKYN